MSRYGEYYEDAYDRAREELGDTDYAADIARDEANRRVQEDRAYEEAYEDWQDSMVDDLSSKVFSATTGNTSTNDSFLKDIVCIGIGVGALMGTSWLIQRFGKKSPEEVQEKAASNLEDAMRDLAKTMEAEGEESCELANYSS